MAAKNNKEEESTLNSSSYADLKGLNNFQRFALIKQFPEELHTVIEWDEIAVRKESVPDLA